MVATRNHPRDFSTPSSRTTQSSAGSPEHNPPVSRLTWSHTPSNLTLLWLAISLPLVIWDTGYVLLRPHSMPGGALHSPIWTPYGLYGQIDYTYGFEALYTGLGFTGAQATVNAIETTAYLVYLYVVYAYGEQDSQQGRGAPSKKTMGPLSGLSESRTLYGQPAARAVLLAFTTASITFAKTVIYVLNEAFSGEHGWGGIGHNDFLTLIPLWIIPNGAWLVFPAYMTYVFGLEILEGLDIATSRSRRTS
ncbi:hypothetical protein K431DRAFT_334045 [Polychaeton citri CBS 116435]|uniref:C6 transcription factor n=1 Tax=Polychaeton citri CBS 116435 TaxID=1314669 RepID=A0A9P4Q3P6_9PEZI|nr:hypothetical protein K431DRAFT_334045 [Polychaeton citri CBS 116435]